MTTEEEILETPDHEKALLLFKEIADNSKTTTEIVDQLLTKVKKGELDHAEGISLLDVKTQLMIFYLLNMLQVIVKKTTGKSIEGDPVIERLVELRVILEKLRPIEQKLKYQIDKLVKIAITGTTDANDPSRFKANPENMKTELGESEESGSEEEADHDKQKKKAGIYVPPKLSAVHYDGDESRFTRREKVIERARKYALQSSVMQELKEEYLDTPTEVKSTNSLKQKEDKYQKHKQEYEENYMTRLPVTKEEMRRAKRLSTLGTLGDEITRFEDTSVLLGDTSSLKASKRSKRKMKGGKKGGIKKRRKH